MGGDFGPEVVLPGAARALERGADIAFSLFGDEKRIRPYLEANPKLAAATTRLIAAATYVAVAVL